MDNDTQQIEQATMIPVRISARAFTDYNGRLYEASEQPAVRTHIDVPNACIRILKQNSQSVWLEMTQQALDDWIDDLDYQIEWTEDSSQHTAQCRRAMATLKAALQ